MSKFISVLLPTRGRVPMLKESIESLVVNCQDPNNIEVLIILDDDDEEALQ